MTSVLLRTVRQLSGEAGVAALLSRSGTAHDPSYLENTDNWISYEEAVALLRGGIEVTEDPRLPFRVGENAVRQHAGTQVATLLRSLGSPEAVLAGITATAAKFSSVTQLETVEMGPGRAVVRRTVRDGFTSDPLLCDWAKGLISTAPGLFGLPPSLIEETECQARGGSECRYVVSWDPDAAAAAADPEQRTILLEAQLEALSQRLESAYATAGDLVSPDDLDAVLTRIVRRAADAVRAPGYVLGVRTDAGELRVFSDGLPRGEAERVAREAMSRGGTNDMLCVRVASSRRDYGKLMAVHPPGSRFFTQEEQLLALYGKYAASVLDTATALDEASRRHQHASALLELAQALAQTGTVVEIATRLAESVRGVIDCERAAVWVWNPERERLERAGVIAREPTPHDILEPDDTPYVKTLMSGAEAVFIDRATEDPVLRRIMIDGQMVAIAAIPIVAGQMFLGLLAVGVEHGPERLASSPDLLEKLRAVAAIAAPSLQNGRLIDELARQVVHDGLTGVLNRRGFSRSFANVLDGVGEEGSRAGLLYVDLDGFKLLNDEHGHQLGDELLRQVANRLRGAFRDEDSVARLGGDEFAVILPRVRSESDLKRAATRAQAVFNQPFSIEGVRIKLAASVGQALAPEDGSTIDDLVRRADTAMYDEKGRSGAR